MTKTSGFASIVALTAVFFSAGCGSDGSADAQSGPGGTITGAGGSTPSSGPGSHSTNHGSGTASGGGGSGSTSNGGGGSELPACKPIPKCDAAPPDPGAEQDWNNDEVWESPAISILGANHRGRDLYLNPGSDQWVIGKIAYGSPVDKDLKGEKVDIYLLRDCGDTWEYLGTETTTDDDAHATVEGVEDTGGHVYFKIPANKKLGLGRHRVHLVVQGDLTTTDLFLEVVPPGTPIFISDVDGTLTGAEFEEFTALLTGDLPTMNANASEAFRRLAKKGYRSAYITARPEYLTKRTREFLDENDFPPGMVHTTLSLTGALGGNAVDYKSGELELLAMKSLVPAWAFGNTDSDAEAYDNGSIMPVRQRVFFQFDDDAFGGRRIEDYANLFGDIDSLPDVCQ